MSTKDTASHRQPVYIIFFFVRAPLVTPAIRFQTNLFKCWMASVQFKFQQRVVGFRVALNCREFFAIMTVTRAHRINWTFTAKLVT